MQKITLIATTTMGFESVLAKEIKALGFTQVTVMDTKVEFEATLADICKCNLWLRTAGRIYVKIGQFTALTFDDLFDQTKELPWEHWISSEDAFPVSKITSRKSELFSKSNCQAIVKKAVAERLQSVYKVNRLPENAASAAIRVQIEKDIVTLSIDTTGEGLNKRGYRAHMDVAPLRETLAAGLVLLSNWNPERDVLLDPFCGTGTILIEAGLIAKNLAPGLNRGFASEHWQCLSKKTWDQARLAAKAAINHDAQFKIYGSDINHRALSVAENNIKLAGLSDIFVQKRDILEVRSRFDRGKIITNPPYGERLSDPEEVEELIQKTGDTFREHFPDWSYYMLSSHPEFDTIFGAPATKNRKLYNGGIKCWFYQYYANQRKKP